MKRFTKYIFLLLIFIISPFSHLSAAVTYPVQLNAQVLPPYTNCLGDYITGDMSRIRVTGLLLDMKKQQYNIGISMKVMQGSQLKLASKTNHVESVRANEIHTFNVKDLFSAANISGKYDGDGYCLKEGGYEFIFQAFDANNPKLALSEPVRFFAYLSQSEPPRLISPADGECVNYQAAAVNFVWMESTIGGFNPNRAYRIEVFEIPENMENYDQESFINSNPTKFTIENIDGNINFYSFANTAAKLIKGRTYLWRTQVYDKTRNLTDGKNIYSSSAQFANGGYSKVYSFKYANCMPFEIKKDTIDKSKKPVIVRVDSSDVASTVYWQNEPEKFPCGYIVAFNKAGDTLSNWAKIEVGVNDSSYTFKNVAPGIQYITHIIGIVDCDSTGTKVLSANSEDSTFTMPKPAEKECHNTIDALTTQNSIEDLKVGEYITANDRNVKLTKIERVITESGDTLFNGEGIASCPLLENKLGIKVKFDSVRINSSYELMKGLVYAPTDMKNAAFIDGDGFVNEGFTGTGASPLQEKKYTTYNSKEDIPDGQIGVVDGKLYARNGSTYTPLGKLDAGAIDCDIQEKGIEYSYGVVNFSTANQWNPPFDYGKENFKDADVEEYYMNFSMGMNSKYQVPWIAMVTGQANSIKAKFDNKQKGVPDSAIVFVCKTKSETVVLESTYDKTTNEYTIEIYGDEAEHSLDVFAMYINGGECQTLGRARIMTMPRQTQELVLVPVLREANTVDGASIEKQLNAIYQPLGVTYKVTVDEKFGDDGSESFEFLNDGLAVEGSGFMSTFTSEMKTLKRLYSAEREVKEGTAYIFVVSNAQTEDGKNVLGDMPRSNQVGFVFTNEEKYADGLTIAHEVGHGLYSFEHTFENGGPAQGSTNNLMDYNDNTDKKLKVWQWNLIYSHKTYTVPFLEDDEDGMLETDEPTAKFDKRNDYKGDFFFDDGYELIYRIGTNTYGKTQRNLDNSGVFENKDEFLNSYEKLDQNYCPILALNPNQEARINLTISGKKVENIVIQSDNPNIIFNDGTQKIEALSNANFSNFSVKAKEPLIGRATISVKIADSDKEIGKMFVYCKKPDTIKADIVLIKLLDDEAKIDSAQLVNHLNKYSMNQLGVCFDLKFHKTTLNTRSTSIIRTPEQFLDERLKEWTNNSKFDPKKEVLFLIPSESEKGSGLHKLGHNGGIIFLKGNKNRLGCISHEMGHLLNLPHIFTETTNDVKKVSVFKNKKNSVNPYHDGQQANFMDYADNLMYWFFTQYNAAKPKFGINKNFE